MRKQSIIAGIIFVGMLGGCNTADKAVITSSEIVTATTIKDTTAAKVLSTEDAEFVSDDVNEAGVQVAMKRKPPVFVMDEQIQYIRDVYARTNDNISNYLKENIDGVEYYYGQNGSLIKKAYYNDNVSQPLTIGIYYPNPSDNTDEEISPIFVFARDISNREYRIYFKDYYIIRYIDTNKTSIDFDKGISITDFKCEYFADENISQILNKVADWNEETVNNASFVNSDNLFERFYYDNITDHEYTNVFMADLDHDGNDEMVLVYYKDAISQGILKWVKVYKQYDKDIQLIYQDEGGGDHASGYFNMFLHKIGGRDYLGQSTNAMWQGYGYLTYRIFYINPVPGRMDYSENEIKIYSITAGNGSEIRITDQESIDYENKKKELLKQAIVLVDSEDGNEQFRSKATDIWNLPSNEWKEINGRWFYYDAYGFIVKNQWIDNCYLGSDGGMLVDTVTPDGSTVGSDGVRRPEKVPGVRAGFNVDKCDDFVGVFVRSDLIPDQVMWSKDAGEFTITRILDSKISGSYFGAHAADGIYATFENVSIRDGIFVITGVHESYALDYTEEEYEQRCELMYMNGVPAIVTEPGDTLNTYIRYDY